MNDHLPGVPVSHSSEVGKAESVDEDARQLTGPAGTSYQLVRSIGAGGYGEVWLARHSSGQFCAVKIVRRSSFDHHRPYEREYDGLLKFQPVSRTYEAQVAILYVGRDDAREFYYYAMELADDVQRGRDVDPETYAPLTLSVYLAGGQRLKAKDCLAISLPLAAALENLHQNNLLHRDVKPSNIIFVNGRPKLADIGLVTSMGVTVSRVGTEGYTPPEGPGTPRADIYALGKVLYEMLTGRTRHDFPELPTDLGHFSDREQVLAINQVIANACRDNPEQRYQSGRELFEDLATVRDGGRVHQRIVSGRTRFPNVVRLGAAVAGIAVTFMMAYTAWHWGAGIGSIPRPSTQRVGRVDIAEPGPIQAQVRSPDEGAQVLAQSDFANGLDGWTADGSSGVVVSHSIRGNPPPSIEGRGPGIGRRWFWVAPTKYLGKRLNAYRGVLAFDIIQTGQALDKANRPVWVRLSGGGLQIMAFRPARASGRWATYQVRLDQSANWKIGGRNSRPATEVEIQTVVKSLESLHIGGEFTEGLDTCGLDNVQLLGIGGKP